MPKKPLKTKKPWMTRKQLETVVFRTMRIEEPSMTREMARKAVANMKLSDFDG